MLTSLLALVRREPVMAFVVVLALVLTVLITFDVIVVADVSGFVETFGVVLAIVGPVVLGGTWIRSRVSPTDEG